MALKGIRRAYEETRRNPGSRMRLAKASSGKQFTEIRTTRAESEACWSDDAENRNPAATTRKNKLKTKK